jgi:hypothetical protein
VSEPPARRRYFSRAAALVRREPILVSLLTFAAAFFAYRWTVDLQRPGAETPEGWRGYTDQGFYLREAVHLGNLETIPAEQFVYGPGYPALAAPFAGIGEHGWPFEDPFLPANGLIFVFTAGVTYLIGRRVGGELVGVASALGLVLATPLIGLVTLPWNTTASLGALMLVLLVALARELRWWHGAALGFAVALAYSARYVDALWVGMAVLTVLAARGAFSRRSPQALLGAVGGALAGLAPTLWLHWATFGDPFAVSYRRLGNPVTGNDFDLDNIGPHALQTFVSPFFFEDNGQRGTAQPLLSSMFLLVLTPLGFWLVARRCGQARRILAVGFGVTSLAATIFYLSYWFTGSFGLGFGAIHYFKMWFPLWTIAAMVAVVEGVRALAAQRVTSRRE